MTQSVKVVDSVSLAHAVQRLYLNSGTDKSFGAWVLDTFYPETCVEPFGTLHDFHCCVRTTDARFYLGGMLSSGRLPAEPLLRAIGHEVQDERLVMA